MHHTQELSHLRYEPREVVAAPIDDAWFPKAFLWYGAHNAVCVIRRTVRPGHKGEVPTHEVHHDLSSLKPEAEVLAALIHAHWSVENQCYHVRATTFGEDDRQVRDVTAAHNLRHLRKCASKALSPTLKASLRAKRWGEALSPDFRAQLIRSLQLALSQF